MRFTGVTCDHDLIIDRGKIRKSKKTASKKFRGVYRHTPAPGVALRVGEVYA